MKKFLICCGKGLISFLLSIPSFWLKSWVLTKIWFWYMVGTMNMGQISLKTSMGIFILATLLKEINSTYVLLSQVNKNNKEYQEYNKTVWIAGPISSGILSLLSLFFAWVIKWIFNF